MSMCVWFCTYVYTYVYTYRYIRTYIWMVVARFVRGFSTCDLDFESQVARNHRPLYTKLAHSSFEVAHN